MQNGFPAWGPLLLHASSLGQGQGCVGFSSIIGWGQSPLGYAWRWKKCDKHVQRVNVCWNTCCLEAHGENTGLTSQSPALTLVARSLGHKSLINSTCLFSFAFLSHFYSGCTDTNPFVVHAFKSDILFKAFIRCSFVRGVPGGLLALAAETMLFQHHELLRTSLHCFYAENPLLSF